MNLRFLRRKRQSHLILTSTLNIRKDLLAIFSTVSFLYHWQSVKKKGSVWLISINTFGLICFIADWLQRLNKEGSPKCLDTLKCLRPNLPAWPLPGVGRMELVLALMETLRNLRLTFPPQPSTYRYPGRVTNAFFLFTLRLFELTRCLWNTYTKIQPNSFLQWKREQNKSDPVTIPVNSGCYLLREDLAFRGW